jgi:hypothetical protein
MRATGIWVRALISHSADVSTGEQPLANKAGADECQPGINGVRRIVLANLELGPIPA